MKRVALVTGSTNNVGRGIENNWLKMDFWSSLPRVMQKKPKKSPINS
jgi:hypothetical protein